MIEASQFGLKFKAPRIVMTKIGEREVKNAHATEDFWTAWRANKDALRAQGYGVTKKNDGSWEVALWSRTMTEEQRAAAHAASKAASDSNIDIPSPAGCEFMPFQRAGIAYALQRDGTLIGDEMGLGKTIQAIGVANVVKAERILVVAPASLLLDWRTEINRWQTLGLPVTVVRPNAATFNREPGWFVINYDIVARYEEELKRKTWDLVIFDECQYLKSRGAKRTKALVGGGRGAEKVDPVPAKRKVLLTGTPIMNRPAELFPLLHYLDPARWSTWTGFVKRYCGATFNGYGYDVSGASNLDELQSRLRETVMIRRLKADVLTELPMKRRQIIAVEPEDEQTREIIQREIETFDRLENEIAAATYAMQSADAEGDEGKYLAAVEKLRQVQGIAFTEIAKVRHETAVAKLPTVIEHLRQTEGKIIVFAHHRDVVQGLVRAFEADGVVSISGDTPTEKRQDIVKSFQTDPAIRFFVGNIKAAGVGLTLTASSHVVFAELDWTPSAVTQAEDRAHRIGQKENVLVQHIVLDGSLDARMAKILVAKQALIDQALDRQEGPKEFSAETITDSVVVDPVKPKDDRPIPNLSDDQVTAVHQALRTIAAFDSDRARQLNGVGFSKMDTQFGCELAARSRLSPRQAAAGMKLARKYRRQYSGEIYERIFGQE